MITLRFRQEITFCYHLSASAWVFINIGPTMKAKDLKCNKMYWSTRLNKIGICEAFADYMAYMVFIDNRDNGWYHCAELKEVNNDKRQTL